jgi:hypothetical protein
MNHQNYGWSIYAEAVRRGVHAYIAEDDSFAGIQLSGDYLENRGVAPYRCQARIVRTTAKTENGCGIQTLAYSCKSVSVSITRDLNREPSALEHSGLLLKNLL